MKYLMIMLYAAVISCSYSVYSSGYPHLKTIAIGTFENRTTFYELDEEVFTGLSELFIEDGRLKIVTVSPDCTLEGEIMDYENKIFKYSDTGVDEYQVSILFNLAFTDQVKNTVIYENDSLILKETYSEEDPNSEFGNESEAREKIFSDLFDLIIRQSLEEW